MTTAYEMPRVRDQDSSFSLGVAGVIVPRDLVYRMRNRGGAILRALLGLWEGQRFGGIDDRPPDIRAVAANTLNCSKNARKIEPFDPKTWLFGKYELYSRRFLYGEADGEGQTLRPLRYRILFGLAVAESRPTSG